MTSAYFKTPERHRETAKGLTLIEILILVGISAFLFGALFVSFSIGQRSYTSSEANVQVQEAARRALNTMLDELRQAGGAITAAGSQVDFQLALGYNLSAPCLPYSRCWGAFDQTGVRQPGWSVRYRLAGTQMIREVVDSAGLVQPGARVLANRISQVSFAYVGGTTNTLTIQLQAQYASTGLAGGSVTANPTPLVMRLRLRNS
ncbi:MAG: hypothetical protein HYW10_05380 [Candidatus Omnitrophica bacterium]|nr:hypothetical protein [Candidatus Omnitrophota bacterium]